MWRHRVQSVHTSGHVSVWWTVQMRHRWNQDCALTHQEGAQTSRHFDIGAWRVDGAVHSGILNKKKKKNSTVWHLIMLNINHLIPRITLVYLVIV